MNRILALGVPAICLSACAVENRTAVVVPGDACTSYGFVPNSADYVRCQQAIAHQRAVSRRVALTNAQITAAAQEACASYGIPLGTAQYDRCVQDEFAARRPG